MFQLLRFLTIGSPDGKGVIIRIIGIVILVVVLYFALSGNGEQRSAVDPRSTPTAQPLIENGSLELDTLVSGMLREGHRDEWLFAGEAGQRVNIRLNAAWQSQLHLILPPRGRYDVAARQQNLTQRDAIVICDHLLDMAGNYRIEVSGMLHNKNINYGDYTLMVEAHDPDVGC